MCFCTIVCVLRQDEIRNFHFSAKCTKKLSLKYTAMQSIILILLSPVKMTLTALSLLLFHSTFHCLSLSRTFSVILFWRFLVNEALITLLRPLWGFLCLGFSKWEHVFSLPFFFGSWRGPLRAQSCYSDVLFCVIVICWLSSVSEALKNMTRKFTARQVWIWAEIAVLVTTNNPSTAWLCPSRPLSAQCRCWSSLTLCNIPSKNPSPLGSIQTV